jgi:hypothetical protein
MMTSFARVIATILLFPLLFLQHEAQAHGELGYKNSRVAEIYDICLCTDVVKVDSSSLRANETNSPNQQEPT